MFVFRLLDGRQSSTDVTNVREDDIDIGCLSTDPREVANKSAIGENRGDLCTYIFMSCRWK